MKGAAASQVAVQRGLSAPGRGDTMIGVLDHAMDVLEQQSMSSPRKSRKSIRELLESVEELSESVYAAWCDGMSCCSSGRLQSL
eukprot:COSAG06_NODE_29203_length_560_cov_2.039046_1_plen_83_part_01